VSAGAHLGQFAEGSHRSLPHRTVQLFLRATIGDRNPTGGDCAKKFTVTSIKTIDAFVHYFAFADFVNIFAEPFYLLARHHQFE